MRFRARKELQKKREFSLISSEQRCLMVGTGRPLPTRDPQAGTPVPRCPGLPPADRIALTGEVRGFPRLNQRPYGGRRAPGKDVRPGPNRTKSLCERATCRAKAGGRDDHEDDPAANPDNSAVEFVIPTGATATCWTETPAMPAGQRMSPPGMANRYLCS